jgi:hypothetical protein
LNIVVLFGLTTATSAPVCENLNESFPSLSKTALSFGSCFTMHTLKLLSFNMLEILTIAVVLPLFEGLEAIEAVHGKKAVTLQKSKSLFEK